MSSWYTWTPVSHLSCKKRRCVTPWWDTSHQTMM
jgi:hypothetical protein